MKNSLKNPFLSLGMLAASIALAQVARVLGYQPNNIDLAQSTDAARHHFIAATARNPIFVAGNRLRVGASSIFKLMSSDHCVSTDMPRMAH